ncbi:MAG: DUF4230 domain-containing protein [Lachnospiraceae bacterium]
MKNKICLLLLVSFLCLSCVACEKEDEKKEPEITQMRAICELATMECYYHNVAKYYEEDAAGFWIFKKDKKFWVEYSGTVTLGIDANKLNFKIKDDVVEITMPEAVVLATNVDENSITEDSFIVDGKSAKITAEDQRKAFADAQQNMAETASKDTMLLSNAQQRAQLLIEEYIENIGSITGVEYKIKWVYAQGGSQE